jgi:hypothetical protein
MKEITGNVFDLINEPDVDSICITTNGIVNANGLAIMGAGVAGEAARRWPSIRKNLGRAINASGNFPFVIGIINPNGEFINPTRKLITAKEFKCLVWSFPTKNDWQDNSDIELIKQSSKMLYDRTKELGLKNIVLPRPGTTNGKLIWSNVKEAITPLLDDRFIIVSREQDNVL